MHQKQRAIVVARPECVDEPRGAPLELPPQQVLGLPTGARAQAATVFQGTEKGVTDKGLPVLEQAIPLHSPSPCPDCRPPGLPYLEDGRWLCRPRSFCAKHDPSRRPPKYWHVVSDTGKPTPFVPLREPFELVG